MNKLALAGLLVFSVSLSSCKEDSTSSNNNNNNALVKATVGSTFTFKDQDVNDPTAPPYVYTVTVLTNSAAFGGKTGVTMVESKDENGIITDTAYFKYEDNSDISAYEAQPDFSLALWKTYPIASHSNTTTTYLTFGSVTNSFTGSGSTTINSKTLTTQKIHSAGTLTIPGIGSAIIDENLEFAPSIGFLVKDHTKTTFGSNPPEEYTTTLVSYTIK